MCLFRLSCGKLHHAADQAWLHTNSSKCLPHQWPCAALQHGLLQLQLLFKQCLICSRLFPNSITALAATILHRAVPSLPHLWQVATLQHGKASLPLLLHFLIPPLRLHP